MDWMDVDDELWRLFYRTWMADKNGTSIIARLIGTQLRDNVEIGRNIAAFLTS